jgi:hypothetical protein
MDVRIPGKEPIPCDMGTLGSLAGILSVWHFGRYMERIEAVSRIQALF